MRVQLAIAATWLAVLLIVRLEQPSTALDVIIAVQVVIVAYCAWAEVRASTARSRPDVQ